MSRRAAHRRPAPFHEGAGPRRGLAAFEAAAWRQLFEENYGRMYAYAYLRLEATPMTRRTSPRTPSPRPCGASARSGGAAYRCVVAVSDRPPRNCGCAEAPAVRVSPRRRRCPAGPSRFAFVESRHDSGTVLGELKAEHREVLLLRFIDDQSVRETAVALGKSEGAIKVLQMRALRAMRSKLGGGRDGV